MIYMKYIFSQSNFLYIFDLHLLFLAQSSQNPWNFLKDMSNKSTSVIIYGLLSSVPEITSEL